VNRRDFTLLLGSSLTQIALSTKSAKASEVLTGSNSKLNIIRTFWFQNMIQKPEDYIFNKNVNQKTVRKIIQKEIENKQILEFDGVYFSYCELALLASLAPISA
jgi:hypothetical protein